MAMWRVVLLLMLSVLRTHAALQVKIDVVESSPVLAQQLAAAIDAAVVAASTSPDNEEQVETRTSEIMPVEPDETLALPNQVCALASRSSRDEFSAALGGGEGVTAALSAAAAARAGLPLLLVQSTPANSSWATLALYPHDTVLAQAGISLATSKGWRQAVLLHEGSAEAVAIIAPNDDNLRLTARKLPPDNDSALLRNLLLVLKKLGETNFIIWCDADCALRVLDTAQRVGLLADRHSYIVLTLEFHTLDLYDYSHGGANVTGLMLFEPESENVARVMTLWREAYEKRFEQAQGAEFDSEEADAIQNSPPTSLLLAYDATLKAIRIAKYLDLPPADPAGPAGCDSGAALFHADTLLNYMRSDEDKPDNMSATGAMIWEADGTRRSVRLTVVELMRGGILESAGAWTPNLGVMWTRKPRDERSPPRDSMTNRTFTFLIAVNQPYVMRRESIEKLTGNDRYEGFCIELVEKLAAALHFNYTFIEQVDSNYGTYNETTKQWNGMMRRLMEEDDVDFAITDLTITAERERAVDFTTPFMNLGISILFRKPTTPAPKMFSFLLPFSSGVWLCLAVAYIGTSLVLYVVGRLCPEEWQNPYPCIEEPPALENQFTLANAFWFNIGAVLLQGSEIAPVAYGTRTVASAWWLFALVITSSYTANLATLMAKKSSTELIHDANELANNEHGITYGAKKGGSTYTFFEHSQNEVYQKMYNHMKERDMPEQNPEGIQKVVEENFAFLMESTTIEYTIERNCFVTMVGGLLDSKGYGIAMKKESPYRQGLNLALLNLQEAGVLREMKETWWKEKHGGGACNVPENISNEKLEMKSFIGLFIVLVVGCFLGIILSGCDLAYSAWKNPRDPTLPFTKNFAAELRFVFHFNRDIKPLEGALTDEPSESIHSKGTVGSDRSTDAGELDDVLEENGVRSRSRSPSMMHTSFPRRRSSIHAASVRLARHARPTESTSPTRPRSPR